MEIKEGMFARTKIGIIGVVTNVDETNVSIEVKDKFGDTVPIEDIVNATYKKIEIVEEGDFVNGSKVFTKKTDSKGKTYLQILSSFDSSSAQTIIDTEKQISSIVTQEQFNSRKYDFGE